MSSPTSFPAATETPELPELPVPQQLVEEMLRHLARAVKTHQLYLPNNPIYQRAIENLRGAFAPIWGGTAELVLHISEAEFRWLGRTVQHETSRAESLPWLFFKDGVRELIFRQGVENDELLVLLDILQRVRKASPDEDDLLTLLWEQEFAYLRYRFIDIAIDGVVPPAPSETASADRNIPLVEVQQEAEEEQTPERQGIVRMEDLDAALYFLDEHEIDYLRAEVQKEQGTDLRRNVLAILLDVLEVQTAPAVRMEAAAILEQFMLHLLSTGDYGGVAYLLGEVEALQRTLAEATDEVRARLARLPENLSDAGVLSQLLQSLDDSEKIPPQEELDALFQQLRPSTLGTVLGWLRQAQSRELRTALERTAARMASMNTAEMLKLIASEDPHIALEAIRRAADLRSPAAVANLAKVVGSGPVELRQAAAQALSEIASPGAARALEGALDDPDRDVRVTAVRALGARGHRAALPKVEAVVTGKAVREADLTEKMAYFEAFGQLAGDAGIEQLDALLNGRSMLLRRRIDPEIRACAALALGRIGSARALETLRRAAEDKDVRVRSAINRALRGGAA
ncbi:MAG TPA: HEAT repeat domain-containing protein [Gemmatimonadaceae bacterium]|nr:HEAT repeat domain-containing protein [Gemmatimonadaceae bacterium]